MSTDTSPPAFVAGVVAGGAAWVAMAVGNGLGAGLRMVWRMGRGTR